MMNFHVDNLGWLLFGCLIGFVLGYAARDLREIKKTVEEVDEIIKSETRRRKTDERGFVRFPYVADAALLLVVVLTVWASFSSQKASNRSDEAVEQVKASNARVTRLATCNQIITSELLKAVNERVDASTKASQANADLQQAWYRFVRYQLHIPPYPEANRRARAAIYADKLHAFVEAWVATRQSQAQNPYPDDNALVDCINQSVDKANSKG